MAKKVLIVAGGSFSTPPFSGDAIASIVFNLSKSLSNDIKVTIFDVWSKGYSRHEKINNNFDIVRTTRVKQFSGTNRLVLFGLLSSIYAMRNGFAIVHCNNQWPLLFNWL